MALEVNHPATALLGRHLFDVVNDDWCKAHNDPPIAEYPDEFGTAYGTFVRTGIDLVGNPDGTVESVMFFGRGDPNLTDGRPPYAGKLPCNLSFQLSRLQVRSQLGLPFRFFDEPDELGDDVPMDVYRFSNCLMQIVYSQLCDRVQRVAVSIDYAE